jgi:hypothetical protein
MGNKRKILPSMAIAEVPFGLVAGACFGAFAGPVGIVTGAVIGSGVGALLAIAQTTQMHRDMEEVDLFDETVGITGGELGSANLEHPPATVGAYSAVSLGLGRALELDGVMAAGPISSPPEA